MIHLWLQPEIAWGFYWFFISLRYVCDLDTENMAYY